MRVLAVTNMYPTPQNPGSGTFVEQQIKGLREIGLDVDVLFLNRRKEGMQVYRGLGNKVRARIERIEPDVVHVMYGGVMAEQVTRAVNDLPTLVTFHGSDLLGEHLSGPVRRFIAAYGVKASRMAAKRADAIVTVSKLLRDALARYVNRSKVRIIPCGIDLDRFKPLSREACRQQLGWTPDSFHVLFPANSGDPVKRPGLAQAALEKLTALGCRAEIHHLSDLSNSEVPIWINASDVLILTSLHEGSPTVVKEALACDLPVVSVDVGDVHERIGGIDGCYLAAPEPNDLAAKLILVHSGSRRVAGRVKMEALSLERISRQIERLYQEVIQFKRKRGPVYSRA